MIKIFQKGDFSKMGLFLTRADKYTIGLANRIKLDYICQEGLNRLKEATPKDTGKTADSWSYSIDFDWWRIGGIRISFSNSNINDGAPIAILLRYGHATNNGGWVEGYDYIDPAIQPVFDRLTQLAWEEVTKLV